MKFRYAAVAVLALGLMGCSKTSTTENVTTNEIVSNGAGILNASDNATDFDAGNSSAGNSL